MGHGWTLQPLPQCDLTLTVRSSRKTSAVCTHSTLWEAEAEEAEEEDDEERVALMPRPPVSVTRWPRAAMTAPMRAGGRSPVASTADQEWEARSKALHG